MPVRIDQVEPLPQICQSDARSAAIVVRLGEIAVLYGTDQGIRLRNPERDVDKRLFRGTDTVLERIFDQRDKQQRSDHIAHTVFRNVDLQMHPIRSEPQTHQLDIIPHESKLLIERDEILVVFIEHITQHVAQAVHGILGLLWIHLNQGINAIERIEQKVRIQLVLQILQFGLWSAPSRFRASHFPRDTSWPSS